LAAQKHPRIHVLLSEHAGIAAARRALTENSCGDWILPLDDDDMLTADAVAAFIEAASSKPWSALIRARRRFIDRRGAPVVQSDWFPFKPRTYFRGMTCDLHNQAQPYLISRKHYEYTDGWKGFPEYDMAGEDCDIFAKLEESGEIELLDRVLYLYRLHDLRASHRLGREGAEDMWRRIADETLSRRALPYKRLTETQPFRFSITRSSPDSVEDVDVVVPFWESDEEELPYVFRRPFVPAIAYPLHEGHNFVQDIDEPIEGFDRIEIACSSNAPVSGIVRVRIFSTENRSRTLASMESAVELQTLICKYLSFRPQEPCSFPRGGTRMEVSFELTPGCSATLWLHVLPCAEHLGVHSARMLMRGFRQNPGYSRKSLDRCLSSLRRAGFTATNVHVIDAGLSAAASRNVGAKQTTKPIICFMDDDTEIANENCLISLLSGMTELDSDLAGPKLIYPSGKLFCAGGQFDDQGFPAPQGLGKEDCGQYDGQRRVPWIPSTCLLVRRYVFSSVGFFDEEYAGSQMEDVDFCAKASTRGFTCAYVGRAAVIHYNYERNNQLSENFVRYRNRWLKKSQ
jgi:glycosyltransferase involved in cell wall biosynthesis